MDQCVVDKVPERHVPPVRQNIERARERQLETLKQIRRLLMQVRPLMK